MNIKFPDLSKLDKKTKLIIAAVIAVVVIIATVFGVRSYQDYYERTFIVIDEVEYRRDITELDLSQTGITEFEKLMELTRLKDLNLSSTGITTQQYDELQAALPECAIRWSVPFQEGYCSSELEALAVKELSEKDLDLLPYFPNLKAVSAEGCRDYDVVMELIARYPDWEISYDVEIGGKVFPGESEALDVSNPDIDEMIEKLVYLPGVTTVDLTGALPENAELLRLQQAFPAVTFVFDFQVFGVTVNTMDEFIDLSGIKLGSAGEVDAIIPHFYKLNQIDMVGCGISNDDMDALNKRYKDIKIVWSVNVCGISMRTDTKYFMPAKTRIGSATGYQCANLKYCTDMQAIDLGHYGTNDVSFVEHMPNLRFLLLCECTIDNNDVIAIGNCTSLEYIELQVTQVTDFWPLTNLSNLRDLNLAGTPCSNWVFGTFGDITPLTQMDWLDRLWVPFTNIPRANQIALAEALPNTVIIFHASGATTSGYRYTPRYFEHRDIMGMYYKTN